MGLFGFFSKEKKEKLDEGLEKTHDGVFSKLKKAVIGKSKVDDSIKITKLAAWTMIANLILNLDEVLTKG